MGDLVTLEISFVSGGGRDEAAEIFWVADNGNGAETRYAEVAQGQTISQKTFPGHCWLLRGKASGEVLGRVVAQDRPAIQRHSIDARRGLSPAPAAGDVMPQDEDDGIAEVELPGGGVWISTDEFGDHHQFERRPYRPLRNDPVAWVEKNSSGQEVAQLVQLEARVDTRWLWWASDMFKRWVGMDYGQEHLVMSALTIAGAYQLDQMAIPWPEWLRRIAVRAGPSPGMLLLVVIFVVGALVAAVVPLRETSVLLFNTSARLEVKLCKDEGFAREPSDRPGQQHPWRSVSRGRFEELPPDVRELQAKRGHHAAFVVSVIVALLAVAMRQSP